MTELERINARGVSRGWHADMLLLRSEREGRTMAQVHAEQIGGAAAFTVPAEAYAIRGGYVHYRFMDGSQARHPHQKRRECTASR